MTLDEMNDIAERARRIRGLRERLESAEQKLSLINKCIEPKDRDTYAWRPTLVLQKAEGSYGRREISICVDLPFGVVQQQAVYEVERIRREINQIGGLA